MIIQVNTIEADMDISIPVWHAQSETFYFDDRKDNDGIVLATRSGEFTTLLNQGRSAMPSPSGKYVGYLKNIGERAKMDIWLEKVDDIVSNTNVP